MPSKKKQHNIRLSDEQEAELERLRGILSGQMGGLAFSVSDVFVVALAELGKRYPADDAGDSTVGKEATNRKRKS